jgi:hypothetical protein
VLAAEADGIISDGEFGRVVTRNGPRMARHLTMDRFAE